jgi:hypothetical protein
MLKSLRKLWPASVKAAKGQIYSTSEACERMLWNGYARQRAKAQLEGGASPEGGTTGGAPEEYPFGVAGAAKSVETEGLDTSQWGEGWSWRKRPEFTPNGEQPQGWDWVLARLTVLPVEERGPWLRTLTWQDRIIGCVQQVREMHALHQTNHVSDRTRRMLRVGG